MNQKIERKPDFFIVGAPKCGTTALDFYLKQHPEIYMAPKELHYFGADLIFRCPIKSRQGSNYFEFFSGIKEQWAGETSVWYLYSKTAAEQIHAFNQNSKIIVILRNPIDFLYSLYYQLRWNGDEPLETFESALEAEQSRRQGYNLRNTTAHGPRQALYYIDTVRFTDQLWRYLKIFGKENVLVILYDDFSENTAAVYWNVLNFLGVSSEFQPQFDVVNGNKIIKNEALWRFIKFGPAWLRAAWRTTLPGPARGQILRTINKINTKSAPRPPMRHETRVYLEKVLTPEVESLSKLLGRDLMHWVGQGNRGQKSFINRGHPRRIPKELNNLEDY